MSPLFAERALSDRLFIPRGRWRGIPKQSRSRRGFRQAQFLLCHSVLFQRSAIGGINRALGGEKAGGRAAGDPLRADKFGDNGIAAAGPASPPLIRVSHAGATATGQRKSGDHVTSATMIMRTGRDNERRTAQLATQAPNGSNSPTTDPFLACRAVAKDGGRADSAGLRNRECSSAERRVSDAMSRSINSSPSCRSRCRFYGC